jgi:hypothetical protein
MGIVVVGLSQAISEGPGQVLLPQEAHWGGPIEPLLAFLLLAAASVWIIVRKSKGRVSS